MQALFIGHAYIDITFLADDMPEGDEKTLAEDYAVSFGGNAVTAAFACAELGIVPDLLCSMADDWLARMFLDMAAKYRISVHHRKVRESSLSFIRPKDGKRAIVRCRDADYLHPYPTLNLGACRALHVDGHQPDAAIHYARLFREAGILTSLDGGTFRETTPELLRHIDIAVVSELFAEQIASSPGKALEDLKKYGCKIPAVTLGSEGLLYRDEWDEEVHMPALSVPAGSVVDTNGAGDIFHGAYVYSYLATPEKTWEQHFQFARAASAHAIQHLGNEASLPRLIDIEIVQRKFPPRL
ncbi:MAG: sugar kinase [Hyphomicrobiaceae bacterium]|nr:sugar kinase [Hyphomicrobiaceae bacterium]